MTTRVVISAAGRGTRMKHLSDNKPKHMIEVNGKPFLYYLLTNLRDAGLTEIIMVVGYRAEHIVDYIRANGFSDNVKIVNQFERCGETQYGTAMPLLAAQPEIGNEPFVALFGDNLYSVRDLSTFAAYGDDFHYIAGMGHTNPSLYGVLLFDEEKFLKEIIEKPKTDVGSNVINTGLMRFTPEIFSALEHVKPNTDNGEYYVTDAITELAARHRVKVHTLQDYWLDFGKPEDVATLSNFLQAHNMK